MIDILEELARQISTFHEPCTICPDYIKVTSDFQEKAVKSSQWIIGQKEVAREHCKSITSYPRIKSLSIHQGTAILVFGQFPRCLVLCNMQNIQFLWKFLIDKTYSHCLTVEKSSLLWYECSAASNAIVAVVLSQVLHRRVLSIVKLWFTR